MNKILIVCTTDSMIWNFLIPHIKMLSDNGFEVECACSRTGDFFDKLQDEHKIKITEIDFVRSPYNIKNIFAFIKLNKLCKKQSYDIVFCHEPVGGAMGRITGRLSGSTVVYMAHGFHFFKGAPKSSYIYYWIERLLSKWTDLLITINDEDYQASKKFFSKQNIEIPGIGVDTAKFTNSVVDDRVALREELGLCEDDVIILSVGELIKRKNHSVVIESMKRLRNKKVHYVIAGSGELESELISQIEKNDLCEQVHLLGYRTDINKLCCSTDIFVMPSLQEGLSVALMEAMACGKPIVASKIRGNVDLIDDNKGGFLVDAMNIDEYLHAFEVLIASSELRNSFGSYNTYKIKKYDIENVKNIILNIFMQLKRRK